MPKDKQAADQLKQTYTRSQSCLTQTRTHAEYASAQPFVDSHPTHVFSSGAKRLKAQNNRAPSPLLNHSVLGRVPCRLIAQNKAAIEREEGGVGENEQKKKRN